MNHTRLKILAVIAMLLDHTAIVFLQNSQPAYLVMRGIGRLAFPIFCFLIAEGYEKTSSVKKYMLRLLAFAFISEIPHDLCLEQKVLERFSQNVFFTLLAGLACIAAADKIGGGLLALMKVSEKARASRFNKMLIVSPLIAALCFAAPRLALSYKGYGILLICAFYLAYENRALGITLLCLLTALNVSSITFLPGDVYRLFYVSGYMLRPRYHLQILAVFAGIPIALYNGEKGERLPKYAFYIFYPAHLILLWLAHLIIK